MNPRFKWRCRTCSRVTVLDQRGQLPTPCTCGGCWDYIGPCGHEPRRPTRCLGVTAPAPIKDTDRLAVATYEQVAAAIGVTPAQARHIASRALAKLRLAFCDLEAP